MAHLIHILLIVHRALGTGGVSGQMALEGIVSSAAGTASPAGKHLLGGVAAAHMALEVVATCKGPVTLSTLGIDMSARVWLHSSVSGPVRTQIEWAREGLVTL